jgi:hypothetical protein
VPNTPDTTDEERDLDQGWGEDGSGVSDRPTVAPPFDLESYAKETAAGSKAPTPAPPAKRSLHGSLEERINELFEEAFDEPAEGARAPSDTAVTMPPPAAGPSSVGRSASSRATEPAGRASLSSDPISRRETPQATQQIEAVRALSAREDIVPGTVLSLANMRIPSNLPPRPLPEDPVVTIGIASIDDETDLPEGMQTESEGERRSEMEERFALGDYSGALVVAESLLEEDPTHVEAREYADSCRTVLQEMYAAKIGPLNRVPVVEVARDQLRWLSIDHRAGFMLSLVDGVSSLEMILDVSGMPSLDALRILHELVEQRIISLRKN